MKIQFIVGGALPPTRESPLLTPEQLGYSIKDWRKLNYQEKLWIAEAWALENVVIGFKENE